MDITTRTRIAFIASFVALGTLVVPVVHAREIPSDSVDSVVPESQGPLFTADLDRAGPGPGCGPEACGPVAELTVHGANDEEREMLAWSISRYEEVGLPLPPLDVTFHDTDEGCLGFNGTYELIDDVAVLHICNSRVHTILHELGHAWEAGAVNDSTRQRFMDHLGSAAWSDLNTHRDERGIEQAATMMATVLNWRSGAVSNTDFIHDMCSYEILTGLEFPEWVPMDCDEHLHDEPHA